LSSISAASICSKRCEILRLETCTSCASSAPGECGRRALHALVEPLEVQPELDELLLMTWMCRRVSTSFSTARAVLSTAISVVGETIHTRLPIAYSTTSWW